jgi:hypothetical protein
MRNSVVRARGLGVALLACAVLGACTDRKRYANDADTGAAAPATKRDMSETEKAPDSTAGVSRMTGKPGIAGDTSGRTRTDQSPAGRAKGKPPG